MALLFANHTATIFARSETPDAVTKVVPIPEEAAGVEITCQITPIGNTVVIDQKKDVELSNPYLMLIDPDDINTVLYGARVLWQDTSMQFRITRKAKLYFATGELEELNYADVEMELLEMQSGASASVVLIPVPAPP